MHLGMVGLGRMGANLVRRLMKDGHDCVVFDVRPDTVRALAAEGATGADSVADLEAELPRPRAVWVMVPAGEITQAAVDGLAQHLEPDDVIIDGGNTSYRDDIARAAVVAERGIHYVDIGTSGGVWGVERGFCLMIGGEEEIVARLRPIFASIAPGVGAAERTPGRQGEPADAEQGFLHCGRTGAGHFVNMVHNGIEYGIMASCAEGLNILKNADAGLRRREVDAETAPPENPECYRFRIEVDEIAELWRRGSVIQSWLLDLAAASTHGSAHAASTASPIRCTRFDTGTAQAATLHALSSV